MKKNLNKEAVELVLEAEQVAETASNAVGELADLLESLFEATGDRRADALQELAEKLAGEMEELGAKVAELSASAHEDFVSPDDEDEDNL